jgi:predicted DNA-binding transcriptional regulator AlpA
MRRFLSRKEFAEEIGVSISTLFRGIKNDEWPFNAFVRIGHQLRYPEELAEELKQNALKRKPPQEPEAQNG